MDASILSNLNLLQQKNVQGHDKLYVQHTGDSVVPIPDISLCAQEFDIYFFILQTTAICNGRR